MPPLLWGGAHNPFVPSLWQSFSTFLSGFSRPEPRLTLASGGRTFLCLPWSLSAGRVHGTPPEPSSATVEIRQAFMLIDRYITRCSCMRS